MRSQDELGVYSTSYYLLQNDVDTKQDHDYALIVLHYLTEAIVTHREI